MEDQICGNTMNTNVFIILPKSNFHKSFFFMGFQQLIPKLQFFGQNKQGFFQFECFLLRIKVWPKHLSQVFILTNELIYNFLKKFVNKKKS